MALYLDNFAESSSASSSSASLPSPGLGSPLTTPDESHYSQNNDVFILVIGGLGYIGSHTCLELLKAGLNVVIVDNLSNSFEDVFHRIKKLANDHHSAQGSPTPLLHFHRLDYLSRSMRFLLESYANVVPSSIPYDLSLDSPSSSPPIEHRSSYRSRIASVIHFAASKSVVDSISRPLHYYKNNVCGLVTLLELLKRHGIRNLVFSSSATVYGSGADRGRALREEDLVHYPEASVNDLGTPVLIQPKVEGLTSPYGRSKYFCEAILADAAVADPLWRIVALRYFNPVGCEASGLLGERPRSQATNLFPVLTQVLTGDRPELEIFGNDYATADGTPVRDFVHVVDVARGHLAAVKTLLSSCVSYEKRDPPARPFRAYNLGSGEGTTVLEAVRSLESASGKKIPLRWCGRRPGDVGYCVASNDRARRELNWCPLEDLQTCAMDSWNFARRGSLPPERPRVHHMPALVHQRSMSAASFGRDLHAEASEGEDGVCRTGKSQIEQQFMPDVVSVVPAEVPLPCSPVLDAIESSLLLFESA